MNAERKKAAALAANEALCRRSGQQGFYPFANTVANAIVPLWEAEVDRLSADLAASRASEAELREMLGRLIDVDMGLRGRIEKPMFLSARGVMVVQHVKDLLAAGPGRGASIVDAADGLYAALLAFRFPAGSTAAEIDAQAKEALDDYRALGAGRADGGEG